jgi:glycosyltransferase involved in cell wall biosynthesis
VAARRPVGGSVTRRLLIVCHDLRAGGLAVDVANEANTLSGRGWQISVATITRDGNEGFRERVEPSVRTIELPLVRPARLGRPLSFAHGLGPIVRDDADLVHVVSCVPAVLESVAFIAARRWRRPIAWTPMFHPARRRYWHGPVQRPAMRMFDTLAPHASRWADVVLAATREEAESFRAAGAPVVQLVPPAVDDAVPRTDAEAAAFRDAVGVGDAPLLLVVASRAERRKGLDLALSTFTQVARVLPSARLVVVGGGTGTRGPHDGVIELGWVADEDLRSALSAADVVFVPSRFEAFSRIVIEAWHEGTAVVVSDGVGLRDEVRRTGVPTVPFGDPVTASSVLTSLLQDRSATARIGERGRAIHRRYLLDAVSEQMDLTFRSLLGDRLETDAPARIALGNVRA